jgi:hypothetical protein
MAPTSILRVGRSASMTTKVRYSRRYKFNLCN